MRRSFDRKRRIPKTLYEVKAGRDKADRQRLRRSCAASRKEEMERRSELRSRLNAWRARQCVGAVESRTTCATQRPLCPFCKTTCARRPAVKVRICCYTGDIARLERARLLLPAVWFQALQEAI